MKPAELAAPAAGDPPAEKPAEKPAENPAEKPAEKPVEPPEPSFSEQLSEQLGGVRGLVESSIPVLVFVLVNMGWPVLWRNLLADQPALKSELRAAVIASVGVAAVLAIYRLARREPIRHAINGVFGIALGAWLAWRSGEARDFYAPGIIMTFAVGIAMIGSVVVRWPLIGYVWAVIADRGRQEWRSNPRLVRVFGWLTLLWAVSYFIRAGVQGALYLANAQHWLGVARIGLSWPLYLGMLGLTLWAVRRATHGPPPASA